MKLISTNPSKNYKVISEVKASTEQDIKNAVVKAQNAFPTWAELPLSKRCKLLTSFISISKNRTEEIAQLIAKETGRPIKSARGIVSGGIDYFEAYIAMAEKYLSPQVTFETDKEIHRVYYEPRGVIACIAPWNYPFMDVAWLCGQALIAGNTIVYKHSKENPLYSQLLEDIIAKSDLPKGVFNVLYGDSQAGQILVHQDIDMISFTGSTEVGQQLTKIAADKFIPIVAELGGSSTCIVFEDIEITDEIIAYITTLRLINNGQGCDAVKRLIVHKSKFDEVVDKLSKYISKLKIGDASKEDTDVGPLISKNQLELIEKQVQDAITKGAQVAIGGSRPKGLQGAYYPPTILTNISKNMRVWKEETFAPVLPVVSFSTEEEAIALANDTQYGLTAHVITNDKNRFHRVASKLKSGTVAENKVAYWNPENPFGGYKKSGMGRLHGSFGFHEVTQVKLVSEEK